MGEIAFTKNETLRELVEQFNTITREIIDAGGEITPEVEAKLASIDLKTGGKVEAYKFVMDRLAVEEEFWKTEAAARSKIAKSCSAVAKAMKHNLISAMSAMGVDELKSGSVRAKLTTSKGELVIDAKKIPDEYKLQVSEWVPDKERIRTALESFEDVPGAKIVGGISVRFYNVKPE